MHRGGVASVRVFHQMGYPVLILILMFIHLFSPKGALWVPVTRQQLFICANFINDLYKYKSKPHFCIIYYKRKSKPSKGHPIWFFIVIIIILDIVIVFEIIISSYFTTFHNISSQFLLFEITFSNFKPCLVISSHLQPSPAILAISNHLESFPAISGPS